MAMEIETKAAADARKRNMNLFCVTVCIRKEISHTAGGGVMERRDDYRGMGKKWGRRTVHNVNQEKSKCSNGVQLQGRM